MSEHWDGARLVIAPADFAELLLRGAAIGIFVALGAGLFRDPRVPARLAGAVFCLGGAGHAMTQSPVIMRTLGYAAAPAWALSVIAGGLFWTFALELFGDHPRLRPQRFAPAALLLIVALAALGSPPAWARYLWLLQNLINAGLMLHVLAVTWAGLRGDLVEPRRRLRGPMIAAVAMYALVISAIQSAELFSRPASQLSLLAAVVLVALGLAGVLVFMAADERLFGRSAKAARGTASAAVPVQDRATLERLRRLLDEEEVWRREDLTIGQLAEMAGVPEHRLRKIINEGLGYRNFAAFLGERRVAAAKAALADPGSGRKSISSIAYEAGFSSLASFNRVFRDLAGMTPTVFRQQALGASIPETPPQN